MTVISVTIYILLLIFKSAFSSSYAIYLIDFYDNYLYFSSALCLLILLFYFLSLAVSIVSLPKQLSND